MPDWYAIDQKNQQIGPISRDQLVQMITAGTLQAQSMVWTASYGDVWKPLNQTEFAPLLGSRRAPPPPPPTNQPPASFPPWSGSTSQTQAAQSQNAGIYPAGNAAHFAHNNTYHNNQSFTEKSIVLIVYALYVAGIFSFALTTIIGLIVAYVKRSSSSSVAQSHFTFQIYTFWLNILYAVTLSFSFLIALGIMFVIPELSFLLLGILYASIFLVFIWYIVRVIKGLIFANDNRAIILPNSWWLG